MTDKSIDYNLISQQVMKSGRISNLKSTEQKTKSPSVPSIEAHRCQSRKLDHTSKEYQQRERFEFYNILVSCQTLNKTIGLSLTGNATLAELYDKAVRAFELSLHQAPLFSLVKDGKILEYCQSMTLRESQMNSFCRNHALQLQSKILLGGMLDEKELNKDRHIDQKIGNLKEMGAKGKIHDFSKTMQPQQNKKAGFQNISIAQQRRRQSFLDLHSGLSQIKIPEEKVSLEEKEEQVKSKVPTQKIHETFISKIKTFQDAENDELQRVNSVHAFKFPLKNELSKEYSSFVEMTCPSSVDRRTLFVRVENRGHTETEADYTLEVEKPRDNRKGKTVKRLTPSKTPPKHSVWLTEYEYRAEENSLVFSSEIPIDQPLQIEGAGQFYTRLFQDQSGTTIFWVSQCRLDKSYYVSVLAYGGETQPQRFMIGQESQMLRYWLSQDQSSTGANYGNEELPHAHPKMITVGNEKQRLIVFGCSMQNSMPSVFLYDFEQQREVLQFAGSSMLLFHRSMKNPQTQDTVEHFSLYSEPKICHVTLGEEQKQGETNQLIFADNENSNVVNVKLYDIQEACSSPILVCVNLKQSFDKTNDPTQIRCMSEWTYVPEFRQDSFIRSHEFNTVMQFESSLEQSFFTISNNSVDAQKLMVCEVKPSGQISCIISSKSSSKNDSGTYALMFSRFDKAQQRLELLKVEGNQHGKQSFHIQQFESCSEQSQFDTESVKSIVIEDLPPKQQVDVDYILQCSAPLMQLTSESVRKDDQRRDHVASCLERIQQLNEIEWKKVIDYPLIGIYDAYKPQRLYIAWRANKLNHLISIELHELGLIYAFSQECDYTKFAQISMMIKGFEPNERLSRIDFVLDNIEWHDLSVKREMFGVQIYQQGIESLKTNIAPKEKIVQIFTLQNEHNNVILVTKTSIILVTEKSLEPHLLFESKQDLFLANVDVVPILADMSLLFVSKDIGTGTSHLNLIDLSAEVIESKIVHSFEDLDVVYIQPDSEIEDLGMPYLDRQNNMIKQKHGIELFVLDDDNQLQKIKQLDSGSFQTIRTLNLDHQEELNLLRCRKESLKSVSITDRTITYKSRVFNIASGKSYNLLQDTKFEKLTCNKCIRVSKSDQIMLETTDHRFQNLILMSEPGSRSFNALGQFGLMHAQEIFNVNSDVFLIQFRNLSSPEQIQNTQVSIPFPYFFPCFIQTAFTQQQLCEHNLLEFHER